MQRESTAVTEHDFNKDEFLSKVTSSPARTLGIPLSTLAIVALFYLVPFSLAVLNSSESSQPLTESEEMVPESPEEVTRVNSPPVTSIVPLPREVPNDESEVLTTDSTRLFIPAEESPEPENVPNLTLESIGNELRFPLRVSFTSQCNRLGRYFIEHDLFMAQNSKKILLSLEDISSYPTVLVVKQLELTLSQLERGPSTALFLPRAHSPQHLGLFLCSVNEGESQSCSDKRLLEETSIEPKLSRTPEGKIFSFHSFLLQGDKLTLLPSLGGEKQDGFSPEIVSLIEQTSLDGKQTQRTVEYFGKRLRSLPAALQGRIVSVPISKRGIRECL